MSIRQRVLDAEVLWNANNKEGAWIQAMIATAATARKRYPQPLPDNKSFKQYIQDITFTIWTGLPNLQNGKILLKFGERPFEDVLYNDYRCMWIHEGTLDEAGLSETKFDGHKVIETLVVGANTMLPDHWILNILNAIRWSPENTNEFIETIQTALD
jgi:hypothetical protein